MKSLLSSAMTFYEPENIEFSNVQEITDAVMILWKNDGRTSDIPIEEQTSDRVTFTADIEQKIGCSWKNLERRADEYLEQHNDGPDAFYSDTVLRFRSHSTGAVEVSTDLEYRTVTGIRSNIRLYNEVHQADLLQTAHVVKSIFITSDNKIALGNRNFYGDWPHHRYECPGGFLTKKDLSCGSTTKSAIKKITDDYVVAGNVTAQPFLLYDFPRILETIMLCIARTTATAAELKSDFYSDLVFCENTYTGLQTLLDRPLAAFHPPSRVALALYLDALRAAETTV